MENQAGGQVSVAERVRDSWMERLFYAVLGVTVLHGGFMLWDLGSMLATGASARTASSDLSTVYLAMLAAYGGAKEFLRWKPRPGDAPAEHVEQEEARWFERGEGIVFAWLGLAVFSIVMRDLRLIPRLPNEAVRTALQVLAVWTGTRTSRECHRRRARNGGAAAQDTGADVPAGGAEAQAQAYVREGAQEARPARGVRRSDAHRLKVLAYLSANEFINNESCREATGLSPSQVNRLLGDLEEEGTLVGEGSAKGRKYRLAKPPEGQVPPAGNGAEAGETGAGASPKEA